MTELIIATLVYVAKDGKTLMIHRCRKPDDVHAGKYNGLGGKIERGETPLECAKREVHEESGLSIKDIHFKGTLLFPKFDTLERDWLVFVFRADDFSGELIPENKEGSLEWVDNDKVLSLNLWEGDRHFLSFLHGNLQFDGKFIYRGGKLESFNLYSYSKIG